MSRRVLVTGAGGRTGGLVVQRLIKQSNVFTAVAGVRSPQGKEAAIEKFKLPEDQVKITDISRPKAEAHDQLVSALTGCDALVIVTSAVPEVIPPAAGAPPGPPNFKWKENQAPEQVDWIGQQVQIDAAKAVGVKHVIIVGSMGGTNPNHNLNKIANGNILQWKRKAEKYLIDSGLAYTVIHPGGLIDQPAGERQLLIGVDDALVTGENRTIPRGDVAEVCIQSLLHDQFKNRAFDIASMPPGTGTVTTDFAAWINTLNGANCDYSINPV